MSPLADTVLLSPDEEARRLWNAALALQSRAAEDVVALCELLDLGLHAAEILAIKKLRAVKDKFPATIALQLDLPDPDVDVQRDAVNLPKALQFGDVVDLLSAPELECVGPRLHRGWEDRRFSCRRSRETAQQAVGFHVGADEQHALLLLAAYRNRVFRYSPPVRLEPKPVLDAFVVLRTVVDKLL